MLSAGNMLSDNVMVWVDSLLSADNLLTVIDMLSFDTVTVHNMFSAETM
jgi:hypothetical protein